MEAVQNGGTAEITLYVHRLSDGGRIKTRPAGRIMALAISPDGRVLATGDSAGRLTTFDLETGIALRPYEAPQGPQQLGLRTLAMVGSIQAVYFNASGTRLLSVVGDESARVGGIAVWDVATGERLYHHTREGSIVSGVAMSADLNWILLEIGKERVELFHTPPDFRAP